MIRGNNINRFLRRCSDHRDQLFCFFELKKLPWPYGWSLGWKRFFRWGLIIRVVSSVVRRGQEMFCGCGRFRFVVRVIYGTEIKGLRSSALFNCNRRVRISRRTSNGNSDWSSNI